MLEVGSKKFFEAYAKISLIDIYNPELKNAELLECPDIQDCTNSIGVEVTAIPNKQRFMAAKIAKKCFNKELDLDDINAIVSEDFKSFNGVIFELEGRKYISSSKGYEDFSGKIDSIAEIILKKVDKFNNNYKRFNENDLYIFCHNANFTVNDITKIVERIDLNAFPYNKVFFNCIDKIYLFDLKQVNQINISLEKLEKYKQCAINYSDI